MKQLETPVLLAQTPSDIVSCFPVMQELRPKLKDPKTFADQILRQIDEGYLLSYALEEGEVAACMGFRMFETLAWGKILYIDDLITREKSRKKGLAGVLLDYAIEQARLAECAQIHLDSGHHRYAAHRFYLNRGFAITCHHFELGL